MCIHNHFNTVAETGPIISDSNRADSEDDSSSSTPTIVIGVIAGIAIIALIVIGVILTAFYLRYIQMP